MTKFLHRLNMLRGISIIKFIYYNFLCSKIKRHGKGYIIPYNGAVIALKKDARIVLFDGHFVINSNKPAGSKAEAYVILRDGARLVIRDTTSIFYGVTIEAHQNALIEINGAHINTGSVILAAYKIVIGKGVLIARHVFIYDSDHHSIYNEDGKITNPPRSVVIGNHVWIGLKSTILRGSIINDGVVVASGSVVCRKIKPGLLAHGNPAKGCFYVRWDPSTPYVNSLE